VKRVPIDATTSTVDHFTPGLAVDRTTGGRTTRLGLTYYYYPSASCNFQTCKLRVGFVSSSNAGASWTSPTELAGPMSLDWLAGTNQGRMFGDYISTSYVNGAAFPAIVVANAPAGGVLDEAAYSTASGLLSQGPTVAAGAEQPVANAASDHPARVGQVTRN
jgi:hypothetical protein